LPRWAESPSAETREAAEIFADEWSRVTHDRFALDVVNAIGVTPNRNELRKGHLAFRDARLAERAIEPAKAAASYETATQALARAGSPLHFLAEIGRAIAMSFEPGDAPLRAAAMFDRAEAAARKADWPSVLARVAASRAYVLEFQGRYVEALTQFDAAQAQYTRIGDAESVAAIRGNRSTVLGAVGQPERAWSEAWQAMRAIPRMVELQSRHRVLGETAEAALALGQPRLALLYQDAALRLIRADLGSTPPENLRRIGKLQKNLAVALRHRAAIELRLQNYGRATSDLAEAGRVGQDPDTDIRRLVNARVEEIRGQALLHSDVKRAIAAFTRAVNLAAVDDYPTFRGALFAQRADAWRRAGHRANAEADLRSALGQLRSEEKLVLAHRQRGSGEEIWGSYFSRSQETYRRLIRQLMDEQRTNDAFAYAEEARAFEPLDLVRQLGTLPPAFRHVEPDGETLDLGRVRAALPPGTFILEYCVLDDRTYVWIVSHDAFAVLTLNVPRAKIDRWTAALQQAARTRDAQAFGAGLFAPYDELLAPPLAAMRAMPHGTKPERLVFVPDGAMHGLPFAALQDPVTRRHLVEDVPVEIAASTALYMFSLLQDQALVPPPHPSAFLIGDPAFDTRLPLAADLKRLPHARSEVARVGELYAPYSETQTGAAASVPAFLHGAGTHTIVHVAAHALVNAQAPSRSLLLLAPSAADTGALDAEELLTQLKLDRTKLVVLSTCSSAGGLPVGPEGVAPLVRPLIAAGVPAVIGSLWDVEDATAEELMVSFHRHYRQGSDAAVAMQSAQLDLLRNKNPGLRSVFAWAPFQVIGHASSPFGITRHN
jgi:CHAT domain-containing protein